MNESLESRRCFLLLMKSLPAVHLKEIVSEGHNLLNLLLSVLMSYKAEITGFYPFLRVCDYFLIFHGRNKKEGIMTCQDLMDVFPVFPIRGLPTGRPQKARFIYSG